MSKMKQLILAALLVALILLLTSCGEKANGVCDACEKEKVVKLYKITSPYNEIKYMNLCGDCAKDYKITVAMLNGTIEEAQEVQLQASSTSQSNTNDPPVNDSNDDYEQNLEDQEPQNIYEPGSPEYWEFLAEHEGIPEGYLDATISSSSQSYLSGTPVTVTVSINGGVAPFNIHWYVDETWNGNERILDDYWQSRNYEESSGDYTSDSNISTFEINLPLPGNDVYVHVDVQDGEKRISNIQDITITSYYVSESEAREKGGFYYVDKGRYLPLDYQLRNNLFHEKTFSIVVFNEYQIPTISKSNEIVFFSDSTVKSLRIQPVHKIGYTIGLANSSDYYKNQYWDWGQQYLDTGKGDKQYQYVYTISESSFNSGEQLSASSFDDYGYIPMNKGDTLTIGWFEGTQFHEKTFTANLMYYTYGRRTSSAFWNENDPFNGTLTKNGYATYDFSNYEPGLYVIDGYESLYCSSYGLFYIE